MSAYSAVSEARWFMSNDSVFEIIGFQGFLTGIAAVVMVVLGNQGTEKRQWLLYGVCAVIAVIIKLNESTYLGFARSIDLNTIIFVLGVIIAYLGYQQAE